MAQLAGQNHRINGVRAVGTSHNLSSDLFRYASNETGVRLQIFRYVSNFDLAHAHGIIKMGTR
jgi:hypothetical protein